MKPIHIIILSVAICLASCKYKQTNCHLTGKLKNAPETTTLFLADWNAGCLIDSIPVKDGVIDYTFKIEHPIYCYMHNRRNQFPFRDNKFLWLEPGEIKITGDFNFIKHIVLEGSASQTEFETYSLLLENATKQIDKIKEQIYFKTDDEKKADTLRIKLLSDRLTNDLIGFWNTHPGSYVTLNALHEECDLALRHLNKKQIQEVYNNLTNELKQTKQGTEINKYTQLPDPPKEGDMAPDIVQPDPEGDTIKLSDYRGKYVLVDFWASTCGPCRGEFKRLRKIYQKYKPKGLEIIGVSGDNNKQKWIEAIRTDSVPWVNISDLNGWKNEAFLVYDVKSIPRKLLVDPKGKIITTERVSHNAEFILEKLFGDKKGTKMP